MNSSDSSVVLIWVLHLAEGSGLRLRHSFGLLGHGTLAVSAVPGRSTLPERGDGVSGAHDIAQLFDGVVDHFFSLLSAVLVEASVSSSAESFA